MPATVTQASPLKVKVDGATAPTPAKGLTTAGGTYAPALNTRVLVELVGRVLYVIGGA